MKLSPKNKLIFIYIIALIFLLLSALLSLILGASELDFSDIITAVAEGNTDSPAVRIFRFVRLPRTLSGLLCGAALAVSGAVMQGVLANRLASPSIVGVSSGAGLAVTLASALGIMGGFRLSLFAFLGAFSAVMLVSLAAKKSGVSKGTVILMGVALNSILGAISDTVTTLIPEAAVMSGDFKIGDLSTVTLSRLAPTAIIVILSIIILFTLSNELDLLSIGDDNAKGLGLNTELIRLIFLILTAFLAGAAVSVAGLLSFVGLLVPHAVRRIATPRSCHLLPLCALFGGGFVTLCDTISRVIFAPYELPVGIIMSFIGAPFFIFILIKKKGGHSRA